MSTKIVASEAKVVGSQGPVFSNDVAEVVGDTRVETDMEARSATEVVAEQSKAGVELFEDDGLGLDFTNLFRDDSINS